MEQLKPVSFACPYDEEEARIRRQEALAKMLREQAMEPLPQGQMVSGWYVPSSPLEGLARGLREFGAHKKEKEIDEERRKLEERRQTDYNMDHTRLVSALR